MTADQNSTSEVRTPDIPRWVAAFVGTTFNEFVFYDVITSAVIGMAVWLADRSEAGILAFFMSAIFFLVIKVYSEMVKMHQQFDASLHEEDASIQRVRRDVLRIVDVNHALLRDADFFRYGTEMLKNYSALLDGKDDVFIERARTV